MYAQNRRAASAAAIVLVVSVLLFSVMTGRSRLGDPWNHVLTSNFFGVPQSLQQQGITPFYQGKIEVGWDGQFYYFAANDLLAKEDTLTHIDSPAYRYQRIGLPLIAKGLSLLLLQSWVSPSVYFLTSLLLVVSATFVLARYFVFKGASPYWALVWPLSIGGQITMLTGLPDAAADALLILAFVALTSRRIFVYGVFSALAALTREAYVIFPFLVMSIAFYFKLKSRGENAENNSLLKNLIWTSGGGLVVFAAWRLYIKIHFHGEPVREPIGIIGLPGQAFFKYLGSGLRGKHIFVSPGGDSYTEAILLLFFLAMIMAAFWVGLKSIRKVLEPKQRSSVSAAVDISEIALGATALILAGLYACFGSTVIMHYSGYLKAANIFLWVVPVQFLATGVQLNYKAGVFAALYYCATLPSLWSHWISNQGAALSRYTRAGDVTAHEPRACKDRFRVEISLIKWEFPPAGNIFAKLWLPYDMIAWVRVKNVSNEALTSMHAQGSINMGSRWWKEKIKNLAIEGVYLSEGPRTLFATPLMPQESRDVSIVIKKPKQPGEYELVIAPVQEQCRWAAEPPDVGSWRQHVSIR